MKHYKTILILLGVLLLLSGYILLFEQPDKEYKETDKKSNVLVFEKYAPDNIESISITMPGSQEKAVLLKKQGEDWVLGNTDNYKADPSLVDTLLDFASNAKLTDIISENPEKQAEFNLTGDSGYLLAFQGQGYNYEFYVGKNGNIMNSQYIRLKDSDQVIQVKGNLIPLLNRAPDDFRDKHILTLNEADLNNVTLVHGDTTLQFSKTPEDSWDFLENGEAFDSTQYVLGKSQIESTITTIASLSAMSFPNTEEVTGIIGGELNAENADYQIHINDDQIIVYGKINDDQLFVKTSLSDQYFTVNQQQITDLFEKEYLQEVTPTE